MAVLRPKGKIGRVSERAADVQPDARFRVVKATYVSRHKTRAEARAALKEVGLENDDIAFIVEEK